MNTKLKCANCQVEFEKDIYNIKRTENHYCSRSCSNTMSNKKRWANHVKIKDRFKCKTCGNSIDYRSKTKYCNSCLMIVNETNSKSKTLGELKKEYKTKSKSIWYSVPIRQFARTWNRNIADLPCQVCGYANHTEICHITAISDTADDVTLGTINSPNNLLILCPNHHWEFDNGNLSLIDIPTRKMVLPTGLEPVTHKCTRVET